MSQYSPGEKVLMHFRAHGWWPCEVIDQVDLPTKDRIRWEKRNRSPNTRDQCIVVRDYSESKYHFPASRSLKLFDAEDARRKLETGDIDGDPLLACAHYRALGLPVPDTLLEDESETDQTEETVRTRSRAASISGLGPIMTRRTRTRSELTPLDPPKKKTKIPEAQILTENIGSKDVTEPSIEQKTTKQLNASHTPKAIANRRKRAATVSRAPKRANIAEWTRVDMASFELAPADHVSQTDIPSATAEDLVDCSPVIHTSDNRDENMTKREDIPPTVESLDTTHEQDGNDVEPAIAEEPMPIAPAQEVGTHGERLPQKVTNGLVSKRSARLSLDKVRRIVVLRHRLQGILRDSPNSHLSDWNKRAILSILSDLETTSVTKELLEHTHVASVVNTVCGHAFLGDDEPYIRNRCLQLLEIWRMSGDHVSVV